MFRIVVNVLQGLDMLTGIMIKPLVFCILIELLYLMSTGIEISYGCN
jgi:hypothetical protein